MRPILAITAGLLVTAIVAAGVTLAVLRFQARTNTQQVNLRNGVTITEDSAIVQAAAKARPAVVSVITQHQPTIVRGSGYLATTDGYIVTNINVIAGASGMTVLIPGDSKPHDARLVDYDCQTGVAVIKIDKVSGLPTLAFADPNALVQGQVIVAVGGPVEGGAVTPGYVSAMHRVTSARDPVSLGRTVEFSDTIQTNAAIDGGTSGGPLLNVGSQVIGIAMDSSATRAGFGLNVADVQDDVQQILSSGQLVVPSLGATTTDVTSESATLSGLPAGSQVVFLDKAGPADSAGLKAGDVITQVDDVHLDAAHPLSLLLRSRFHANQRVTVTYSRGGTSTQAELSRIAPGYGARDIGRGERLQVEFGSVNPTGPLHIGHGRGVTLGDSICRLLEFTGHSVQREYYVNSDNTQTRRFGASVYARLHGLDPPEGGYTGEYVIELAEMARRDLAGIENLAEEEAEPKVRMYAINKMVERIRATVAGV